jgi:type IV pilus assembly protein PilM
MIRFAINKNGPIALDIGSNSIKMLQFAQSKGDFRLAAIDKIQYKFDMKDDPEKSKTFIVDSIKEMLSRGSFTGTKVVSCLPNDSVKIKSLRLDPTDTENIEGLLKEELAERFDFDSAKDEIRYITAGKVYHGSELKNEVIFFATDRATIENHIAIIEESGLTPDAIDPVPCAILRSFQRTMRREDDRDTVRSFIDIGSLYTTVIIGSCNQIYFIKQIPSGGKQLNESVSSKLGIGIEEAMLLRSKIQRGNTESLNNTTIQAVADAMSHGIEELASEISLCFKYCAVTFRGNRPQDAILTGGEAYEEVLVKALKTYLDVDVKTAHPFHGIELCNTSFGADENSAMCEWAVAAGLGLKNWHVNDYIGVNNERN